MKYYFPILGLLLLGCLTSCEFSDNGTLDGLWYLNQKGNSQTDQITDVSDARITWGFQGKILKLMPWNANGLEYMMRFEHSNNQLILSEAFQNDRVNGDEFYNNDSLCLFQKYGITHIPDTFDIIQLNRKKMELHNDRIHLYFMKY